MSAHRVLFSLLLLLVSTIAGWAQAQTRVRLLLDQTEARPGSTIHAALELEMANGWHTYWVNPSEMGGPGIATSIEWSLPKDLDAEPIQWPVPMQLEEPSGVTHVYEGRTLLIIPIKVATNAAPGTLQLKGTVKWLECQEECVPGTAEVTAVLRIAQADTPSPDAPRIKETIAALPRPDRSISAAAHWESVEGDKQRALLIDWTTKARRMDFYPFIRKDADVGAKSDRPPGAPESTLRIRKLVTQTAAGWPTRVAGLLVTDPNTPERRGYEVELVIQPPQAPPPAPFSWAGLLPMLGAALLGGLILNIMPCVLPVIALKVLSFVKQSGSNPARVRKLGLVYGLGVLSSFLVLALILLGLQAAGEDANWNTAFQSPYFRVALCVLMVLVALNLFGVFEVSLKGNAINSATEIIRREGPGAAFFNGVLAAVLATPCTAPFLATAVAFAFTQPPLVLVLIFLTIGAGLALPFVLLCWQPAWLKLLPRPGDWMVRFKVAMGFPILGTAVWIFWFTATRMGHAGVLWFGLFLIVIAAAAWAWGEFAQRAGRPLAGAITAVVLVAGGYLGLMEAALQWRLPASARQPKLAWQPWSRAAIASAHAERRPILVDFTADNCANCKFNLVRSIEVAPTIERLNKGNFAVLEGDFTDANPEIAAELRHYNRRGVPLVLVYSKDPAKAPKVMPTIFTPAQIQEALDWAVQ